MFARLNGRGNLFKRNKLGYSNLGDCSTSSHAENAPVEKVISWPEWPQDIFRDIFVYKYGKQQV